MFIRQQFRTKNGQRHANWALVESYRTASGPRQRVVAWLGKLDEVGRLGVKQVAEAFDETQGRENSDGSTEARRPQPLNQQLQFEFDDEPVLQPRWVEVNAGGVRVENLRQFGRPWMFLHLIRTLQLDTFLQNVMLPTRSGPEIRTRCISKPTDHQQIRLEKLGLKLPARII